MLQIRQEQFQILKTHSLVQFENEMLQHLSTFAPRLFEIRGEAAFRELVRSGIQTAMGYGFTNSDIGLAFRTVQLILMVLMAVCAIEIRVTGLELCQVC